MNRPDDPIDRDARLLAALRHAPDRDALPPPALSAAILARAREQAKQRAAPRAWRQMLDAWRLPPHLAAAFGSVAVAAVVGLMWSVNDPEPPARGRPVVEPQAMAPAAAPASAAQARRVAPAEVAPSSAVAEPSRAAARDLLAKTAPALPATTVPSAAPPSPAAPSPAAPSPAAPSPVAPSPLRTPALEAAQPGPVGSGRPAVGAPVGTSAEAPAAGAEALDRAAPPGDRARTALPTAPPTAPLSQFAQTPAARSVSARPPPASTTAADPLAALSAGLDAAGASALWRHAGRTAPHGAAQQAWWTGLRDATRGQWTRLADAPVAPLWLELVLPDVRSDAVAASLWLEPGDSPALVLRTGSGVWRTPLAPPLPASWQQAVAGW